MVGITSYGAYVPRYRLSRDAMGKAWGQRFAGGERAVANHDEDSFTMACEAAANCLAAIDPSSVGGVYFASVSAPYVEKQASTLIGTVCGLSGSISTADLAGSTRASTAALKMAMDAAQANPDMQLLVCAADIRPSQPGSELEQFFGDAGAALLIGAKDPVATISGSFSVSEEFVDSWRKADDPFVQRGDTAFIQSYGYQRLVKKCVAGLLAQQGIGVGDVSKLILNAPDPRSPQAVAKGLEFPEGKLQDPLVSTVGDAGNASPLMLLAHALDQAQPGDKLLLCNYAAGNADAFLIEVMPAIEGRRPARGMGYYLSRKREMANPEKLLKFRGEVPMDPIRPFSSGALSWKEIKQNLQLMGQKCNQCGRLVYPRRHICTQCGAKDDFQDMRLATTGKLFTFTKDYLFPSPDSPNCMGVADLDGGARFYGQMADADLSEVRVGAPVELVIRRYHEGDGFVNYFWKLRPLPES